MEREKLKEKVFSKVRRQLHMRQKTQVPTSPVAHGLCGSTECPKFLSFTFNSEKSLQILKFFEIRHFCISSFLFLLFIAKQLAVLNLLL